MVENHKKSEFSTWQAKAYKKKFGTKIQIDREIFEMWYFWIFQTNV